MTDEPVKRKRFEIPEDFHTHVSSLRDQEAAKKIEELCKDIEKVVAELGISDQCTAFFTDGDLAISWKDYWKEERRAAKSVSRFEVIRNAVLKTVHRVHPSSCPGRSSMLKKTTCIRLWTTWSRASGFRSGVYFSTRTRPMKTTDRSKKEAYKTGSTILTRIRP